MKEREGEESNENEYMNNHVHSAPQPKKEESREEEGRTTHTKMHNNHNGLENSYLENSLNVYMNNHVHRALQETRKKAREKRKEEKERT